MKLGASLPSFELNVMIQQRRGKDFTGFRHTKQEIKTWFQTDPMESTFK